MAALVTYVVTTVYHVSYLEQRSFGSGNRLPVLCERPSLTVSRHAIDSDTRSKLHGIQWDIVLLHRGNGNWWAQEAAPETFAMV